MECDCLIPLLGVLGLGLPCKGRQLQKLEMKWLLEALLLFRRPLVCGVRETGVGLCSLIRSRNLGLI